MSINSTEKKLVDLTIKDGIKKLNTAPDAAYIRMSAYDTINEKGEEIQVQIIVTRDKDDFLKPFETEYMSNYE